MIRERIADAVATTKAEVKQQIENSEKLAKHWEGMAGVLTKEKDHDRELFDREKSRTGTRLGAAPS